MAAGKAGENKYGWQRRVYRAIVCAHIKDDGVAGWAASLAGEILNLVTLTAYKGRSGRLGS